MLKTNFIFLLLATAALIAFAGCSESEPTSRTKLNAEFEGEFSFVPPANVIDLHCKTFRIRESWLKWFMFSYDLKTFQRITNQNFIAATPEDMQSPEKAFWSKDVVATEGSNEPSWWSKPLQTGQFYYKENFNANYHMSYIYIWIDAPKDRIYVKSVEWD